MLVHCFYSFLSFYVSAYHCCFHVCILAFWLPISNKLELSDRETIFEELQPM